jgi:hypothetical protein
MGTLMPQTADLKARGLHTNENPLSLAGGSMTIADNVVVDREDTTEQRRGVKRYGPELDNTPKTLFDFKERLHVHHGDVLSYDSDGAGTAWTDYTGTWAPPTGAPRLRTAAGNKNLYVATGVGVTKLDALGATPRMAGAPKGLDGVGSLSGGSGFMADNTQVAYRVVFGYEDANKNKILGAPSSRIIVTNNAGGTRDVALTFTLPSDMTVSHFYQIYRSAASATASDEPNDEMQLIVEKNPTSSEITALSISFTDSTPDNLRGATLYTSPSEQGISQANDQPPLCRDLVAYKQMMLYLNTVSRQRMFLTLIAVGSPNGIQADDTIVINGVTYTGKASETAASGQFKVDTGGTPAQNIDATARSLVRVINTYASNTGVYAYYLSGFDELPGKIMIEERTLGGSVFYGVSSRGGAFSPVLPSSGTTYPSTNDVAKNRVYISKKGQPEAVPILQYVDLGSADKDILRGVALREEVFVMKEDGIFRITGDDPSTLRGAPFDTTANLKCIESAAAFNNQVAGFTDQGIALVSDSGTAIVSRAIETTLLMLSSAQFTGFDAASFGVPYESDRKYLFFTVSDEDDTAAQQAFVYNAITNTFTRWYFTKPDMETVLPVAHGLVHDADNKLYLASADSDLKVIWQERKDYLETDYADDQFTVQITGQNGKVLTFVSTADFLAGYTLSQGSTNKASVVVSVDSATQATVRDLFTWEFASATVYKPIAVEVEWAPIHGGNTGILKHFQDLLMHFRQTEFDYLTLVFTSDISGYTETVELEPGYLGWGAGKWGAAAWGGRDVFMHSIRTLVPLEKCRAGWLNVGIRFQQALANFAVSGLTQHYTAMTQRRF